MAHKNTRFKTKGLDIFDNDTVTFDKQGTIGTVTQIEEGWVIIGTERARSSNTKFPEEDAFPLALFISFIISTTSLFLR